MGRYAVIIAVVLLMARGVIADPSDTTKLYDGGISAYEHKRYLTAYMYRTAGVDTLEFNGWQGEAWNRIVLDTHSHSFGLRSNGEFQWSFELGSEPTSYPGADGGRFGTWNTGDSIGFAAMDDQGRGSKFTYNGVTGNTIDSICAYVVNSKGKARIRASVYSYTAGVDSSLIDSTPFCWVAEAAGKQLVYLPVLNNATLTNGTDYAIMFNSSDLKGCYLIQTDTTGCDRVSNASIDTTTQWPDPLDATITADDPYLSWIVYQPYSDEMTYSFDLTYDSLDFIPEYDSWSGAPDSGHWISQVFHAGFLEIGVGAWNWYGADGIYYEYQNGSFITLGRPRVIDSDAPPDSTFGKVIVEPLHNRLNIIVDTTWLTTAVYPVTIENNTISDVCPLLTDAAGIVGGYAMAEEAQIGPWVIFKGTDSSRMYAYHTYMADDGVVTDSSGIDWALFTTTTSSGDADSIQPDTTIDYLEDSIYLSTNNLSPPLVTVLSDDSAYLLTDTTYYPAAGGEDWLMYNFMNYQNDFTVGVDCDTCLKSYWQPTPGNSAPPIEDPFFAPNPDSWENKGPNIVWGTYIEPGGRVHFVRMNNVTVNGKLTTTDD